MSHHLFPSIHLSHHPSITHSFTLSLKLTCFTNLSHRKILPQSGLSSQLRNRIGSSVLGPRRMHSVHVMRPIATNGVAWSVCGLSVCSCVCLLVTFVSPAKTAETIDAVWERTHVYNSIGSTSEDSIRSRSRRCGLISKLFDHLL